jgi:hypothetical protein
MLWVGTWRGEKEESGPPFAKTKKTKKTKKQKNKKTKNRTAKGRPPRS